MTIQKNQQVSLPFTLRSISIIASYTKYIVFGKKVSLLVKVNYKDELEVMGIVFDC